LVHFRGATTFSINDNWHYNTANMLNVTLYLSLCVMLGAISGSIKQSLWTRPRGIYKTSNRKSKRQEASFLSLSLSYFSPSFPFQLEIVVPSLSLKIPGNFICAEFFLGASKVYFFQISLKLAFSKERQNVEGSNIEIGSAGNGKLGCFIFKGMII
jgi:hypothetical protein